MDERRGNSKRARMQAPRSMVYCGWLYVDQPQHSGRPPIEQVSAVLPAICQVSHKIQTHRPVDLLDMGTGHTLYCIDRKTVKSLPLIRGGRMSTTTATSHSGADALRSRSRGRKMYDCLPAPKTWLPSAPYIQ